MANEEAEWHVTGLRLRVKGTGNLRLSLSSLQDVQVEDLVPYTMQSITRIEPFRLSNIQSQRIRAGGETTEIDEVFEINRLIIFAAPVYLEYPSGN